MASSVANVVRSVEAASGLAQLPPVEVLQDFEAIHRFSQPPVRADLELLDALANELTRDRVMSRSQFVSLLLSTAALLSDRAAAAEVATPTPPLARTVSQPSPPPLPPSPSPSSGNSSTRARRNRPVNWRRNRTRATDPPGESCANTNCSRPKSASCGCAPLNCAGTCVR